MTTRRRRRLSADRPFTSPADIPLISKVPDMVRICRKSAETIRRQCRAGTFRPRPDGTNPYTWTKATILRYLEQPLNQDADLERREPLTH